MASAWDHIVGFTQAVEVFGLVGYYNIFNRLGNLIDAEEGALSHRVSQLLGRHIMSCLGYQVEVRGLHHVRYLTDYCVVSTHASNLDWAFLLGYFPEPLRFIAKRELTAVPAIGLFLKQRGILIDRRRKVGAKEAIRAATRDSVPFPILIFPEGTRTSDGKLQPFRRGGLEILSEAGLKMVPVCIRGTFDAYSRHAVRATTGLPLRLTVGEPVPPASEMGGVDAQIDEVERRMRAMAAEPFPGDAA